MKPGYKTTEFWFTLVSFIFSGLYLTGLIDDHTQKEELISVVSHAVESCILILGQCVIFYKYIKGRKEEKIAYEQTKQINVVENTVVPNNGEKNDKSRNNNARSRKTNSKSKRKPTKRKTSSGQ